MREFHRGGSAPTHIPPTPARPAPPAQRARDHESIESPGDTAGLLQQIVALAKHTVTDLGGVDPRLLHVLRIDLEAAIPSHVRTPHVEESPQAERTANGATMGPWTGTCGPARDGGT
ncbi:MAG: hypothetical protein LC808_32985 [Actinobacteria bacterium]|nr:hypothetical protein [Actinomycetota bacterium]